MSSIQVAAVGKLRTPVWLDPQSDYLRRISRYVRFQLIEVKDVLGRGVSDAKAVKQESASLLGATSSAKRRIALTPAGKEFDSVAFAEFLQKQFESYGDIAFLIGGPSGLSGESITACDVHLSLSKMTFPHELARVVLLEQIYRAFSILRGEKYHR